MKQLINEFTQYELTAHETLVGMVLTEHQRAYIQNLLSQYAQQKIQLTYDAINPVASMQAEAELQGQIGILKLILANHEEASQALNTNSI